MAFLLAAALFKRHLGLRPPWSRAARAHDRCRGARAIGRRFRLALAWLATGTLLGGLLPVLGMAVIAAFIPFYWLPIRGEIASAKPRRDGPGRA